MEMYKDPPRMVDEMSALGLRHVGYGIPTAAWGRSLGKMERTMGARLILYLLNESTPGFYHDFHHEQVLRGSLRDSSGLSCVNLGSLVMCMLFS